MVKKSLPQKPIRILQQLESAESERKKSGQRPAKPVDTVAEREKLVGSPVNEGQPAIVKKPRGRKPKPRNIQPPPSRKDTDDEMEIEGQNDIPPKLDDHNRRREPDLLLKFNELEKTVDGMKQSTHDQFEQFKQQLGGHVYTPGNTEVSDDLLERIRTTIAEEVSKEMSIQFNRMKEFFSEFKMKRISKEKQTKRASNTEKTSLKPSQSEIGEPPVPKKRGRKKKIEVKASPAKPDKKKNISSVAEVSEARANSPRPPTFTFSNLQEPLVTRKNTATVEAMTPKLEQEPENDDEADANSTEKIEEAKEDCNNHSQLFHNEPEEEVPEVDANPKITQTQASSEQFFTKAKEQSEEVRSARTTHDNGKSARSSPDLDVEFDLNAFSLNN